MSSVLFLLFSLLVKRIFLCKKFSFSLTKLYKTGKIHSLNRLHPCSKREYQDKKKQLKLKMSSWVSIKNSSNYSLIVEMENSGFLFIVSSLIRNRIMTTKLTHICWNYICIGGVILQCFSLWFGRYRPEQILCISQMFMGAIFLDQIQKSKKIYNSIIKL